MRGFTLIELSIVLVIIALIVAGILTGLQLLGFRQRLYLPSRHGLFRCGQMHARGRHL